MKLEGLEQFDNIAYINASDNHLTLGNTFFFYKIYIGLYIHTQFSLFIFSPLESFGRFPALRELDLSLNSLHNFEIHAEEFQRLEVSLLKVVIIFCS